LGQRERGFVGGHGGPSLIDRRGLSSDLQIQPGNSRMRAHDLGFGAFESDALIAVVDHCQ
jgi:hypothetical protein